MATVDFATVPHRQAIIVETYYSATGVLVSCKVTNVEPANQQAAAAACPDKDIGTQGAVMTRNGTPLPYKVVRQSSDELMPTE